MISAAVWMVFSSMLYSLRLDTGSFPKPLTAKEEQEYLLRAGQGDLEARNILIERNLRLVAHIMKKYYTASADQEDLISIGTIGLIKGISTFDGSKGARLATYAARCIENAILTQTRPLRVTRKPGPQKTRFGAFYENFCPVLCNEQRYIRKHRARGWRWQNTSALPASACLINEALPCGPFFYLIFTEIPFSVFQLWARMMSCIVGDAQKRRAQAGGHPLKSGRFHNLQIS